MARPAVTAPRRRRAAVLRAVKLALAFGLLAYIATAVPVDALAARFKGMAPGWFALAFALYIASHFLGAYTLYLLLRPQAMALSVLRVFRVNLAAHFYGLFVPGGALAGGAIRWYRLGYSTRKMPEVLAALVTSRVLEIVSLGCLALAGWLVDPAPAAGAAVGTALGALLVGSLVVYALLSNRSLALRLTALLRRLVTSRRVLRRAGLRFLAAVRDHGKLGAPRHAGLLALSLMRQVVGGGAVYALALGLGLDITLAAVIWVRSLVAVLTMLPVSFAGLGVREAGFILLLVPYGVEPAGALALSLSVFGLAILMATIGGLIELRHLVARSPTAPDESKPGGRLLEPHS